MVLVSWVMAGIGSSWGGGGVKGEAASRKWVTNMSSLGHMQVTSSFIMAFSPILFEL